MLKIIKLIKQILSVEDYLQHKDIDDEPALILLQFSPVLLLVEAFCSFVCYQKINAITLNPRIRITRSKRAVAISK